MQMKIVFFYVICLLHNLCFHCVLNANKTHGFYSRIVISVYPLDLPSIKKAIEYRNN